MCEVGEVEVDEKRFSRQLYILGVDGQHKLNSAKVLIFGAGGVGVEIAKNLILAGTKHVSLYDTNPIAFSDLASNSFIDESNIGRNRAEVVIPKLKELHPSAEVVCYTSEDPPDIHDFNCVVISIAISESKLTEYESHCRKHKIGFVVCQADGVFGSVFVDHGEHYFATNPNGVKAESFLIKSISNTYPALIELVEQPQSLLGDDSTILFQEVPGIPQLEGESVDILDLHTPTEFEVDLDASKLPRFESGKAGHGIQLFKPVVISFQRYAKLLANLTFESVVEADILHYGRDFQILVAYGALRKILNDHQSISEVEYDEILRICREIGQVGVEGSLLEGDIDELVLRELIRQFEVVIAPTASVIGGIASQEVIKFLTRQHTPINQFLVLNWLHALPNEIEYTLHNDRYDNYRIIFGDQQQKVIEKLQYFIVGAGAIGCELLKNFAGMGVGIDGSITITDPDHIEQSNLSRQFLFRDSDIGHNKAECAVQSALRMNPALKIESQTNRVDDESALTIFNKSFFKSLSGVCTALDNIQARVLVDSLCCQYGKPLIDSGTEGSRASFSSIVPMITEHYSPPPPDPNQNIPSCTVHSYPTTYAHTCIWAREIFQTYFHTVFEFIANSVQPEFLEEYVAKSRSSAIIQLKSAVTQLKFKPTTVADCAVLARSTFEDLFVRKIIKVVNDNETNKKAWTNGRNKPAPIEFNPEIEDHVLFVNSVASIYARIWGIPVPSPDEILPIATEAHLEPPTNESDVIEELITQIRELTANGIEVHPEEFEKDDDSTGHMDFITSAANLRAINYQLQPASRLEAKRIAGKIVPAMATTTAMICGFVCLEMYTIHCISQKTLEDYRSGSFNMASARFSLTQPQGSTKVQIPTTGEEFDIVWQRLHFFRDVDLTEMLTKVETTYHVSIRALRSNGHTLWSESDSDSGDENQSVTTLDHAICRSQVQNNSRIQIAIDCLNPETGESVPLPFIQVHHRG
jgi:ubiquitin-activating enzyme E1